MSAELEAQARMAMPGPLGIDGLSDDAVSDYEDSPTGDASIQLSALHEAAKRAAEPDHVSDVAPPEMTVRQRLGLDP